MGDSPIRQTQIHLSGKGLRSRIDSAEQLAVNPNRRKKKKKPVPEVPREVYRPPAAAVDARQAQIEAQQAADRAAIAAMNRNNGFRRTN